MPERLIQYLPQTGLFFHFNRIGLSGRSAHFPSRRLIFQFKYRKRAPFWKKSLTIKVLDPTLKASDSHSTCLPVPKKVGKRPNSIPIYSFGVKSAKSLFQSINPFFIRCGPLPSFSRLPAEGAGIAALQVKRLAERS